ncbi:MAG: SHOCT domain-containing protein [Eubacteriales bacterium]
MMRIGFEGGYNHMMLFGGVFMFLIGIVVIGLLIYLVMAAAKSHKMMGHGYSQATKISNSSESLNEKAILILNERFAKGEIDEEEYTSRKAAILKN